MSPKVLGTVDAARYIGMSPSYLRRARTEGTLKGRTPAPPHYKVGTRKVLYKVEDLDRWIEAHQRVER